MDEKMFCVYQPAEAMTRLRVEFGSKFYFAFFYFFLSQQTTTNKMSLKLKRTVSDLYYQPQHEHIICNCKKKLKTQQKPLYSNAFQKVCIK